MVNQPQNDGFDLLKALGYEVSFLYDFAPMKNPRKILINGSPYPLSEDHLVALCAYGVLVTIDDTFETLQVSDKYFAFYDYKTRRYFFESAYDEYIVSYGEPLKNNERSNEIYSMMHTRFLRPRNILLETCTICLNDFIVNGIKYVNSERICLYCQWDSKRMRALSDYKDYLAQRDLATPKWADLQAIDTIYQMARFKTIETGIPHHVDHIVPLRSEFVSGLHVGWNLQIITATENLKKGNRFGEGNKPSKRKKTLLQPSPKAAKTIVLRKSNNRRS